jgi:hypothetical protein
MALAGSAVLTVAACGDESSNRQFAGGPRTPGANETISGETSPGQSVGSPTAVPTAMPVAELLATSGAATIVTVRRRHDITAIDVEEGAGIEIWSNPGRALWAAAIDPTGATVALLTSPAKSASSWAIDFVNIESGDVMTVELGNGPATPGNEPDSVAEGRGGIAWQPDSSNVAVALPTGGLWQVYPDGSQVKLVRAGVAKRPAAVAISADGGAITYVDQPSGSDGSGIWAGSMRAKPIDPIVVLPADRSGNRYAREVAWLQSGNRVATSIEREELGTPQGDLFFVDTHTGVPQLAWTSPPGRDVASVESFAISPDGRVVAFVTNPSRPGSGKPSSLWLMQIDGPTIERFDLPAELTESTIAFTPRGTVVAGLAGRHDEEEGLGVAYLLGPNGEISELYQEQPEATPEASPRATAVASPIASPVGSPSPVASTTEE